MLNPLSVMPGDLLYARVKRNGEVHEVEVQVVEISRQSLQARVVYGEDDPRWIPLGRLAIYHRRPMRKKTAAKTGKR